MGEAFGLGTYVCLTVQNCEGVLWQLHHGARVLDLAGGAKGPVHNSLPASLQVGRHDSDAKVATHGGEVTRGEVVARVVVALGAGVAAGGGEGMGPHVRPGRADLDAGADVPVHRKRLLVGESDNPTRTGKRQHMSCQVGRLAGDHVVTKRLLS